MSNSKLATDIADRYFHQPFDGDPDTLARIADEAIRACAEPADYCALAGDCDECLNPSRCICEHHCPEAEHAAEYIAFLETQTTKFKTGHCPNCEAAIRPLHCCVCEGCDGCREQVAITPPATPVVAREAVTRVAEEIAERQLDKAVEIAAIITRHLAEDGLVDEVQRRMDQVVESAVEWHQAGREGGEWFEAAEKLGAAIDSLLELRDKPAAATECFCGTELEAGLCPNGHDPVAATPTPELANSYETVVRQVVGGCSNWHDIQHKIVPRIIALLNTSETVELQIARRFLVKNGYERCVSAACGCNSWHERRP